MDMVKTVINHLAETNENFASIKADEILKTNPLIQDIYNYIANAKRSKEKLTRVVAAARVAIDTITERDSPMKSELTPSIQDL